jgi:hypothetical protein
MSTRIALIALALSFPALCTAEARQTPTNADAAILQDFRDRIDKYVKLHEKLDDEAPRLKETKDPAKIQNAQKGLAARIGEARSGARQGEIFTPEIARLFRRLMNPELKGPDAAETKQEIKEDAPKAVRLKVNAPYPEGQALPTVPPNLLTRLPQLPEDLEYRIVGRDLILRDVDANLIVDFIPNAIR